MTTNDIDAARRLNRHPNRSIDDKFERVVAERDDLAGALVDTERERDRAEAKVAELTAEREHMELNPAGTAGWLKNRVNELTAEAQKLRAELDKVRAQLADTQHRAHTDATNLQQILRDKTALANENEQLKAKLAASRSWWPARKRDEPAKRCNVDGCTGKHIARGYCVKHYARFKKTGDPLGLLPGSHEARLQIDACGTPAGAKRHRSRGEKPCDRCREAAAAALREWRRNKRAEVAK